MLSHLSVQNLQKLDIRKFGHRLEIIDAIKNNEFTLTNPYITSPCISFWQTTETSQSSSGYGILSLKDKQGKEFGNRQSYVSKNSRECELSCMARDNVRSSTNRLRDSINNGFGVLDIEKNVSRDYIVGGDTQKVTPMPDYSSILRCKACGGVQGRM